MTDAVLLSENCTW